MKKDGRIRACVHLVSNITTAHGCISVKTRKPTGVLQLCSNTGQSPSPSYFHVPTLLPQLQVSSELATQLSDTSLSPEVPPARHALLDQAIRAKIGAEAARLRGQVGTTADSDEGGGGGGGVDIVRREIEAALERENLDRERSMTGDEGDGDGAHGDVKNPTVLLGDLEEVRQKVDRYRARASLTEHPEVKEAREAIASCYRYILPFPHITGPGPGFHSLRIDFDFCDFPPNRANPAMTLNCWSEVAAFRNAVAKLEQVAPFRSPLT